MDFGDGFDIAQQCLTGSAQLSEWRHILQVKGEWLGGIASPNAQVGSAAILIYFRWLLLHQLVTEDMISQYDRFIVTRSDFFWPCPHPPLSLLSQKYIWFPDGEFYGGLTDRHVVVSRSDLQ
jgi:hypothetical protein